MHNAVNVKVMCSVKFVEDKTAKVFAHTFTLIEPTDQLDKPDCVRR